LEILNIKTWFTSEKANTTPILKTSPKVKLVAVAKDESAYLPEWVYHHAFFGFDAIDVYVNRTADNSIEMLNALVKHVPSLSVKSADWLDTCPNDASNFMQFIVYAKAFAKEQQNKQFDYIMFLDIDEFWTPQDMSMSIQDCITQYKNADSISFSWLNEHGSDEVFQRVSPKISGQLSPLVKTLLKVDSQMEQMSLHFPKLRHGKSVLVDGESFVSDVSNRECIHRDLIKLRSVMIVHRMFRSPMEYVSLLSRGRPSDKLGLKLNRGGYNRASGDHCTYVLDTEGYEKYRALFSKWLGEPAIQKQLFISQQFVQDRYTLTLGAIDTVPMAYFGELLSVFKGCDKAVIEKVREAIRNSTELLQCNDPQSLMTLATKLQKLDMLLAKEVFDLAKKL
jgi:hypothetical protein